MSKFYLENEYAQRIDLQDDINYCLVTDSDGLGIANNIDYSPVGDIFFMDNKSSKQSNVKLNFNFFQPNPFNKLQVVSNFMIVAKSLSLIYVPDLKEKVEYKRDIDLLSFEKTNGVDGVLRYTGTFNCKSLFYTTNQNRFVIEKSEGEMRFDFRWPARFNDYANRSAVIDNNGHVEAPFTIEFNGYAENPVMEVYKENTVINRIKFNLILTEGEKLLFSTLDGNLYVFHKKATGEKLNIINLLDIQNENFFKLPLGTTTVKFTSDTGAMSRIFFNVYRFYKVV